MVAKDPVELIPFSDAHSYCDPSTTKLPLPRSEQENDDYYDAFVELFFASGILFDLYEHTLFPLDLNDADMDGVWRDSNGEAPTWDNFITGHPEAGYQYAAMEGYFREWRTSHHEIGPQTYAVVCEFDPQYDPNCFNPLNCIMDQQLCNGPLSSIFSNGELMTCIDDFTEDIEVESVVYTRKTITGIRSGKESTLKLRYE